MAKEKSIWEMSDKEIKKSRESSSTKIKTSPSAKAPSSSKAVMDEYFGGGLGKVTGGLLSVAGINKQINPSDYEEGAREIKKRFSRPTRTDRK